jgi:hypothetical protein
MFCPRCKAEYRWGFTRCNECDLPLVHQLPVAASEELDTEPELVVVRTYNSRFDADIARMTLEAAGIVSMERSHGASIETRVVPMMAGIDILVHSEDAKDADSILSLDLPRE